jgi:hypothetical protein
MSQSWVADAGQSLQLPRRREPRWEDRFDDVRDDIRCGFAEVSTRRPKSAGPDGVYRVRVTITETEEGGRPGFVLGEGVAETNKLQKWKTRAARARLYRKAERRAITEANIRHYGWERWPPLPPRPLSELVRVVRGLMGDKSRINYSALSRASGISRYRLRHFHGDRYDLSPRSVIKLAAALGVRLVTIYGADGRLLRGARRPSAQGYLRWRVGRKRRRRRRKRVIPCSTGH